MTATGQPESAPQGANMLAPPSGRDPAPFAKDFGPRVLLTVDTEEEFDWDGPFTRDQHGLSHISALPRFQTFCEEAGAHPAYLVDWPIVQDEAAVEIIGEACARGAADVGVQLHPWVNPPFDEEVCTRNSFAGNLPRELEAAKLSALRDAIEHKFNRAPRIYRAGRYGLGPSSAELLKANGIAIDTSVRSLFDYSVHHGPDYSRHPLTPYWVDSSRELLELPVTSAYWGLLREFGPQMHRMERHFPALYSAISRLHLLQRIALTPEGVTVEEAMRGIDIALDTGVPLIVLSFHSPSLAAGHTPYVRNESDVEALYDWLWRVYAYLDLRGVKSISVDEILAARQV